MELDSFFDALAEVPNMRSAAFSDLDIKDGGNVFLFDGYSSVYAQPADLGQFVEEVAPGAFKEVLASGRNVPMLHEHHPHQLLGTTRSGRVTLDDDARGLRVRAKLVKTDLSARVKALADSGDITGMSTGFVVGRENHRITSRGGKPHRLISNFRKLLDVSTTWDPAYPTTEAQFRSMAARFVDDPDSWQRLLLGAYPQLEETGHEEAGSPDGDAETRSAEQPEEEAASGAADQRSVAARKRALQFLILTTGGIDQ